MNTTSKIIKARKDRESLRTTIPQVVSQFLEISDKNELEWKMYSRDNKKFAVIIKQDG